MDIPEHIKAHEILGVKTTVKHEGVKVAYTDKLNFIGNGLNVTKVGSTVVIDVPNTGVISLQGNWDANANSPNITGTTITGYAWIVSVAGNTNLGGITDWRVGDIAVKTSTSWIKIDNEDIKSVWGGITGDILNQTDLVNYIDEKRQYMTTGVCSSGDPTFHDNGDGTVNLGATEVYLHTTTDYTGPIEKYSVPAVNNLGPFDGTGKYVAIDYNNGNPIYSIKVSSQLNGSNVIAIYKCWWDGTYLHSLSGDLQGLGLSNKIANMLSSTHPYSRAGNMGLILTESDTRTINVSSAYVFAGTVGTMVGTYTSASDICTFVYYNGASWVFDRTTTKYNNTQYNPVTGLVSLTAKYFTVNWIYRSIGDVKEVFYILGDAEYKKLSDAQLAKVRIDIPTVVSQHCLLVGRIIVENGINTGSVESAFDTQFQGSTVIQHNDTENIQGGILGEYYHLSNAQYIEATNLATASSTGLLSPGDWNTFNNKENAFSRGNLIESISSVLTITGGSSAVIGTGTHITVNQASSGQSGYISSADWNTFNNKQPAGSYENTLTKGNLLESISNVLTITGGSSAVIGTGVSITVTEASSSHGGYLSASDYIKFSNSTSTDIKRTITVSYTANKRIGTISTAHNTYTPTYDAYGKVSSVTNGTDTWTITRVGTDKKIGAVS